MGIEIRNLTKTFGTFIALHEVNLRIPDGELVALLGPSGSGKTTLLRLIAGLETPDPGRGAIHFDGKDVADTHVRQRGVGFVFQHYALFKHMSVFENVAFGLRVRPRAARPDAATISRKVRELLRLVQLEGLENRYPAQLSGGQRQRVALARALAVEPKVLLLDEPFGALDAKVRAELRRWLRKLHDEVHVTSVFVTHDQEEALEVADRVVVMNRGRIEQVGTPEEVFHQPANDFVMQFLGNVNLFHGRIEGDQAVFGSLRVKVGEKESGPAGTGLREALPVGFPGGEVASGAASGVNSGGVKLMVRPHELEVRRNGGEEGGLHGKVTRVHRAGPVVKVEVVTESGQTVYVEQTHERHAQEPVTVGETVYVSPRLARVFVEDFTI